MPEGHTIHRLARNLRRDLAVGEPVAASSPQGRFAASARRIDGGVVTGAEAAGKHLFVRWDDGALLHVHLGLIGKFRRVRPDADVVGEVRLRLVRGDVAWHLSGPQTCDLADESRRAEVLDSLGPDPLRRDGRPDAFVERLSRSRKALGAILLDQDVIAGIGNVYRAELLFMIGLHPSMPAAALPSSTALELWDLASELLRIGVRLDRIVTVTPDDAGAPRGRLRRDDALYVYHRDGLPCRRCGTEITAGTVAGRTIWWCPRCQRR